MLATVAPPRSPNWDPTIFAAMVPTLSAPNDWNPPASKVLNSSNAAFALLSIVSFAAAEPNPAPVLAEP